MITKARLGGWSVYVLAFILIVAGVGAAALVLGPEAGAASASPSKVVFRVGWTNDPNTLNPFLYSSQSAFDIGRLNYDQLTGIDPETLKPRPELAKSWEVSEDSLVWIFKLRDDVKWQDGERFTATDVAFTYNYIIENDIPAYASFTTGIDRVVALDDTTVEFRCSRPKSNILSMVVPVLPEHIWKDVSPEDAQGEFQNDPPVVGTGPFQVVEREAGKYVRMVVNEDYWGTAPQVDEIIFNTLRNPTTATEMLKLGQLDYVVGFPPTMYNDLKSRPGITVNAGQNKFVHYLNLNCWKGSASLGNPVLKDVRFRQALNWAIDRDSMVSIALSGLGTPVWTFIPGQTDWSWTPDEDEAFGFDLSRAKHLLDEAGYRDSDGDGVREDSNGKPIKLRLMARADSDIEQNCAKMLAGWFGDIGLDIEFEVVDVNVIWDSLYNTKDGEYAPDFDMYYLAYAGYYDPDYNISWFTKSQIEFWNEPCWINSEYDLLYQKQATTLDNDERVAIVKKMQQIFYEQSPQIFTVAPLQMEAWNSDKWAGFVLTPTDGGVAFYGGGDNVDTMLSVHPVTGETETDRSTSTSWIIALVVAAALVVIAVLVVIRRHRVRVEEDA